MGYLSRAAKFLLTSAGTLLSIGSIADGEFLKRSGSSVISAALGAGASVLGAPTTINDMVYSADGSTWVRVTPATLQSILGTATATASKIPLADSNALLDSWVTGGASLFGDGSDGSGVINTPTTLTKDMFYTDLSVTSTLDTAGYKVFVRGTLSGNGTIRDNGNAASGTTSGAGLAARGTLNSDSGTGGAGRSTLGAGNAGGVGSSAGYGLGTTFKGGDGGSCSGGSAGVAATPTARSASAGSIRTWSSALQGHTVSGSGVWQPMAGGGGGGGGGCNPGTGTASSGAGGGGGGSVVVAARYVNASGMTISANGGSGSAASAITGDGAAGGGGGGSGGWVCLCAGKIINAPTLSAAGGAAGAGGGGGTAGSTGATGFTQTLALCAT